MLSFLDSMGSVRSLLCIGSHADDIEIGAGGTVLALRNLVPDLAIDWVVLTASGQRRTEAETAARRFAGENLATLEIGEFRERYFPYDPQVKEYFDQLGSRLAPDVVMVPWEGDAHQDHRTASLLAHNTFRDHLIMQYEIPKYDGDLGRPTVYFPIGVSDADTKVSLLFECFSSQHSRFWFTEDTFRSLMRLRGVESRADSGYAEAFHVRKLVLG